MPSFGLAQINRMNQSQGTSSVNISKNLAGFPQTVRVPEPSHNMDNLCDIT
jgi:hypothetical protein